MKKLIVFGASGHAKVLMSIVAAGGEYRVAGTVVSDPAAGGEFCGLPLFGGEDNLPRLMDEQAAEGVIIAVGDNYARYQLRERIDALVPRCCFPAIIHPSAQIAPGVTVGQGSVVAACATLNADSRVGEFCIVDAGANVGHDAVLGAFVSLGPRATVGGWTTVADFTAVGMGAVAIEKVRIGTHAVVGAGAVVIDDLPDHVVAMGNPARVKRKREVGETYYR